LIVADANLLVSLLVPGPGTTTAESIFRMDPDWVAPLILRSELRNVLVGQVRREAFDQAAAQAVMAEAERILDDNEFEVRSESVLALCFESGCSAYDCEYVALAGALRVPLVTSDKAVLAAFPEIAISPDHYSRK
jgi:predicted nucleic acid-binding protein